MACELHAASQLKCLAYQASGLVLLLKGEMAKWREAGAWRSHRLSILFFSEVILCQTLGVQRGQTTECFFSGTIVATHTLSVIWPIAESDNLAV
jgi:hypothetical protein